MTRKEQLVNDFADLLKGFSEETLANFISRITMISMTDFCCAHCAHLEQEDYMTEYPCGLGVKEWLLGIETKPNTYDCKEIMNRERAEILLDRFAFRMMEKVRKGVDPKIALELTAFDTLSAHCSTSKYIHLCDECVFSEKAACKLGSIFRKQE